MASEPKRRSVLAALAFSILGMAIAGYLLWEHWNGGAMLGCSAGGTFDCESVNQSMYSEIRGIPVALWGVLAYFLSAVLLIRALTAATPDEVESPLGTVFLFALVAVAGDCFLLYAQAAVIGHWCLWCLMSYVASFGLLASCWMALGSPARVLPAIKRDWDQLGKAKPMAIGIVIFILIMIGYLMWKPLPSGTPTVAYLFNAPYNKGAPPLDITNPFKPDPAITEIENAPFMDPGPGAGYAKGAANPVLTIVEFGDLECPACQHFSWTMDEFMEKHPNDVRWVFRHYPLDMVCNPNVHRKMHEFACACARGAEAAGIQGKFWEMEHEIYSQTDDKGQFMPKRDLTDPGLEAKATKVGLDLSKWKEDQGSEPIMAKISDDVETGVHVGIESTPTLFVNGRKISGGKDVKTLEKYLDLAKKGKLNPRGPAASGSPTSAASAP